MNKLNSPMVKLNLVKFPNGKVKFLNGQVMLNSKIVKLSQIKFPKSQAK